MTTPRSDAEYDLYDQDLALPPLSREEELVVFRARRTATPEERQRLDDFIVRSNISFAAIEALHYRNRGNYHALRRAAVRGMAMAIQYFDETLGNKFISYAVWWIRQQINAELVTKRGPIRYPPRITQTANTYWREWERLEGASPDRVLDSINCHGPDREDVLHFLTSYVRLDRPDNGREGHTIGEHIPQPEEQADPDLWEEYFDDPASAIDAHLQALPERYKAIVVGYFGLQGKERQTLDQIGSELNITRERVRQLRNKALSKLRASMLSDASPELATRVQEVTSASHIGVSTASRAIRVPNGSAGTDDAIGAVRAAPAAALVG